MAGYLNGLSSRSISNKFRIAKNRRDRHIITSIVLESLTEEERKEKCFDSIFRHEKYAILLILLQMERAIVADNVCIMHALMARLRYEPNVKVDRSYLFRMLELWREIRDEGRNWERICQFNMRMEVEYYFERQIAKQTYLLKPHERLKIEG